MDTFKFYDLACQLSELEQVVLLCLGAQEHCLLEAPQDSIHDVARELALVGDWTDLN